MSMDNSPRDSRSESTNSSPNVYMLRNDKDIGEHILFGASGTRHTRSATVRRASSASVRKDSIRSQDDLNIPVITTERYNRRSLDSTYRQSLESISEYKTKSFSSGSMCVTGPDPNTSLDLTYSDCTDYATRSGSEPYKEDNCKTFTSGLSSSYLSWIESVNSEYLDNVNCSSSAMEVIVDVDNKVGEWNNFWLNYNNPHNRYALSTYLCGSNYEDKTGDDISDCKSTCSTQREFNEKTNSEHIILTFEELQEALQHSMRITDILQRALKRNDNDFIIDRSRQDSYYSQHTNSMTEELSRERSFSYHLDSHSIDRQTHHMKHLQVTPQPLPSQLTHTLSMKSAYPPAPPSTTNTNCINSLLTTGVADILKRVINKRRDDVIPNDTTPSTSKNKFSYWATTAK